MLFSGTTTTMTTNGKKTSKNNNTSSKSASMINGQHCEYDSFVITVKSKGVEYLCLINKQSSG